MQPFCENHLLRSRPRLGVRIFDLLRVSWNLPVILADPSPESTLPLLLAEAISSSLAAGSGWIQEPVGEIDPW